MTPPSSAKPAVAPSAGFFVSTPIGDNWDTIVGCPQPGTPMPKVAGHSRQEAATRKLETELEKVSTSLSRNMFIVYYYVGIFEHS